MEYNQPSEIVKDITFGDSAREKVMTGINKLTNAVKSTLGASGKCVIYEDATGKPIVTKDGVTVANSVVLFDPVENIGATLIKEAAQKTVKEAGDGTTTSTVLAHAIINTFEEAKLDATVREIKEGIDSAKDKVLAYLKKVAIPVKDEMLDAVASISANNDKELGGIIAEAYKKVGKDGVVLMEESESDNTYVEIVDGVQFDSGIKSPHLVTDQETGKAILDNPYVLIVASPIPNLRKIQPVLEHVLKEKRSLLIVAQIEQQPMSALLTNKVKGALKVNIVDVPGFGATKRDTIEDIAAITGATVINEELGDDMDMITPDVLGEVVKSVTDNNSTVITVEKMPQEALDRVDTVKSKLQAEKNPYIKKKIEQRLAMLAGAVGIIKVGGNSAVELKEKKDRVEDAIYAVKAALKEGIVPGGGVALLDASNKVNAKGNVETTFMKAITAPYYTILENAGLPKTNVETKGRGIDVISGKEVNMISAGVIDPVLVTKTALINASSVATTIMSTDCIISNMRINEGGK
jgi:chaperonin GroEL